MRRLAGLVIVGALALAACGSDDSGAESTAAATTVAVATTSAATVETTAAATTAAPATTAATTTAPPVTLAVIVVESAGVVRSEDGSQLTVSWEVSGDEPATVTWGTDPNDISTPLPVDAGATSVTIADPAPGGRAFFRIAVGDSGLTSAERRVILEGAPNFRDLGGYESEDGRRVKWGQVYRSGALGDLTEADLAVVDQIGLQLVCDFRSDPEVEELPDPDGVATEQIRLDVNDESVDVQAITEAIIAGDLSQLSPTLLEEGMPRIALDFPEQWSELLLRISDEANRPTNFHCTAGKDRAGWGSAMVLRSLGVPEATVMEDYLLSNEYLAEKNAATVAQVRTLVAGVQGVPEDQVDMTNLIALLDVRPEYLQAAFDAVDEKYGSFEGYLTDGLGLTQAQIDALRDSLLE